MGIFHYLKVPPLTGKNETGMSDLPQKHPQKTFSPNPGSINSIQPTWVCRKNPQIWCLIIFLLISMAIFGVPDQVSQDSFRWGRAVRTTDATAALPGMAHGFSPQ
jgi:hypothetical protein